MDQPDRVHGEVPGYLSDPVAVISRLVLAVEPGLDQAVVAEVVASTLPHKPRLRRLAQALETDPDLLISGLPEGPVAIGKLIRALRAAGGQHVVLPRCAHCGAQAPLPSLDGLLRICSPCAMRKTTATQPCSGCGQNRRMTTRDRHGRPRCENCPPDPHLDPLDHLVDLIEKADPGLSRAQIAVVISRVLSKPTFMRQVAWALEDNPALLTGQAAMGSRKLIALLEALITDGARNIVMPPCPICGRTARLTRQRDGLRCCRRCHDTARLETCSLCERDQKVVAARTARGEPVCYRCWRNNPINFETCSRCERQRLIVRRSGEERLCASCTRPPVAVCAFCGRARPCLFGTGEPRCDTCARRARPPQPCARCGQVRRVRARLPDGQPLCGTCGARRERCLVCGKTKKIIARTEGGEPLCRPCYNQHPKALRTCVQCGTLERPYHYGLCASCALARMLHGLLGDADGTIRADLRPVLTTLCRAEARRVLTWLSQPTPRRLLTDLAASPAPVSHELLDSLQPEAAVRHLRAALVVDGVLPARDERLTRLIQHWIPRAVARLTEDGDQQMVRAFATWHHLRRLRHHAGSQQITQQQMNLVRNDVNAAVHLLTWLRERDIELATCTQHDIDHWLDQGPALRQNARTFLAWAVRHQHAHQVRIPLPRREAAIQVIEHDRRWALVRHLLDGDHLDAATRLAGLLLLLFAQPLSRICRLRLDDVIHEGDQTLLALGPVPTVLPPPLDKLANELIHQRHGRPVIGRSETNPWLFPGGLAGQPISLQQLMNRLHQLGIRARPARNTTLMELAAELPAIVLARLLGLNISAVTRWTEHAAAPNAGYAAQLSRRTT